MGELLGFLYESCQELGLIKELLKLPLGLSEQVGERCWFLNVLSIFYRFPLLSFIKTQTSSSLLVE